jgi:hypothetical protein
MGWATFWAFFPETHPVTLLVKLLMELIFGCLSFREKKMQITRQVSSSFIRLVYLSFIRLFIRVLFVLFI